MDRRTYVALVTRVHSLTGAMPDNFHPDGAMPDEGPYRIKATIFLGET